MHVISCTRKSFCVHVACTVTTVCVICQTLAHTKTHRIKKTQPSTPFVLLYPFMGYSFNLHNFDSITQSDLSLKSSVLYPPEAFTTLLVYKFCFTSDLYFFLMQQLVKLWMFFPHFPFMLTCHKPSIEHCKIIDILPDFLLHKQIYCKHVVVCIW